jgi:flavin-dependent dehydrogenase
MDSRLEPRTHYDVIVVGGRPAGASLAARLGRQGWHVLLLDRATFPSSPTISYPAIFASAMALLDEIGVREADYARDTPQIRWWINEFREDFRTFNRVPNVDGRDYAYAIDRTRFDEVLWHNAARFPTITARQNFVVTDLLWQGEQVSGICGRTPGGTAERFTADCVVGAGGRFGPVARKTGAGSYDERSDLPTAVYYAYWQNAAPYDERGPVVHIYTPGYGYGFLLMDSADGRLGVGIYGQRALLELGETRLEAFYTKLLHEHPRVWRRLCRAERITPVHGMRKIGNLYRQGGGPGWVLVGDALHQVDPMDAQGIYDALFMAKVLSQAIDDWKRGRRTWHDTIAQYEARVHAETHARYVETLARIKREIFTRRPDWAWKSYIRWLNDDPEYKRRLALMMTRGMDAAGWLPASVLLLALLRGAGGDIRRLITRQPRADVLPLHPPALHHILARDKDGEP